MKILNMYINQIIFEDDFEALRETLVNAIMLGVNLSGADLRGVNLSGVNLSGVNLSDAYLRGADLSGVNLRCADLSGADLSGADLSGADLRGVNLSGVNLSGAENIKSFQCGEYNRVSYAVKHENKTMFKIGCFWGSTEEAIAKAKEKYGEDSNYEKLIRMYDEMMIKN